MAKKANRSQRAGLGALGWGSGLESLGWGLWGSGLGVWAVPPSSDRVPLPTGSPAPRAAAQAEDGDFTGAFVHSAPGIGEILAGTRAADPLITSPGSSA